MKRLVTGVLIAVLLALPLAVPVSADAPTEISIVDVFDDINPCTGLVHTVTIVITISGHFHDGRFNGHADRTITTSPTGFVGHGSQAFVENGQVIRITLTDILTNEAGDRIRAHVTVFLDPSTEVPTLKFARGALMCVTG